MARRRWRSSVRFQRRSLRRALDVAFIAFIRDELKFDSIDALVCGG
jgi:FAD synthase